MTALDRKAEFKAQAARDRKSLSLAALDACGITWDHLTGGLAGVHPLSAEVKQKFAAYIGRSVEEVFGESTVNAA